MHANLITFVQKKSAPQGKTTAYVCEERTWKLPTSDPLIFSRQIKTMKKLIEASDRIDEN